MNTKLTFYCTHCQYGGFEKVIFETVLDESFEDIQDAKEWVDDQIPTICDEFDFELVFDWIVINYKKTKEDIQPVTIKKAIKGKLTFPEKKKKKS